MQGVILQSVVGRHSVWLSGMLGRRLEVDPEVVPNFGPGGKCRPGQPPPEATTRTPNVGLRHVGF